MAAVNMLGVAYTLYLSQPVYWIAAAALLFAIYLAVIPRFTQTYATIFGLPNWITILRIVLLFLLLLNRQTLSDEWLFSGFLFVICLDGVDGYLARKLNQSSVVGGNLDMEADAFLVLAISWIHFEQARVDWWILIPAMLKYIYELTFFWSRSKSEALPKKVRATIAVIFFLSLALGFVLPPLFSIILLQCSAVLIYFSFASSMYFDLKSIYDTR